MKIKAIYSTIFFNFIGFALFVAFSFSACDNSPSKDEIVEQIIDKKNELRYFATTNTRNLRLRNTPDLQGEVIEFIAMENTLVEYLQDSTTFETQVGQGTTAMLGRWYKIRTDSGNEGWVFGPLLAFKDMTQNKAITAQEKAEAAQMARDSSKFGSPMAKAKTKKDNGVVNTAFISQYNAFLHRLGDKNVSSVSIAANELQSSCQNCTPATADQAYVSFRGLLLRVETNLRRSFKAEKYGHLQKELLEYGRVAVGNDSLLWTLENNGFKLGLVEGKINLVIDIDYLARQFYRLVSAEMRLYLNQMQIESETYWVENKKLIVKAKKIAEWAVFWSNFADKNQQFVLQSETLQKSREYLQILIYGLQNSPVFGQNKSLNAEYKEAYEYIIEISANSRVGEQIVDYYKVLQENDFVRNGYVEQAQLAFFN